MDKIYKKLINLGVPQNLLGFEAMHTAIDIILSNNKNHLSLSTVYQITGEKLNTSSKNIERSIRTSIAKTLQTGNQTALEEQFGCLINRNITNSEWLSKIVFDLQHNSIDNESVRSHVINIDGYKAFTGTIKILPKNQSSYTITGDWLYRPDTHCWYGGGRSFHESYCEIL